MKIKYTPGENGLVGKSHQVEIVAIELNEVPHINQPLITSVKIKYETGETEWISGMKLFNSTDMVQKALIKRVI